MEQKRLCRARYDRRIFGVCGGLAHYFNIDPTLVRVGMLLLVFAYGVSILFYLAAALIMPDTDEY